MDVDMLQLKPYLWQYHYTFSLINGRPLSLFDRELAALSAIQNDDEANLDLPVIESYGWFELPPNFNFGRFKLRRIEGLLNFGNKNRIKQHIGVINIATTYLFR
jgi:hypothetical protein